ncbi:MAG: NAD(P)/FAD-dependent oxidoreductase [Chloroflexales bacterium]|nr:NAD(P)/FAD-dependent oxidoreductase [Chloroflexales bacterium]
MHDVIVIGGGPAGLAATAYALDKGLDVVLLCTAYGGQAGAEQWIDGQIQPEAFLGLQGVVECRRRITAGQGYLVHELTVGVFQQGECFQVVTELCTRSTRTVIVATGAQQRVLGLPNEHALIGRGLAYSITTHAQLAAGRDVVVIGGTPHALHGVAELARSARRIALIVPPDVQIDGVLAQRLRELPHVTFYDGYTVTALEEAHNVLQCAVVLRGSVVQRIPAEVVFVDIGLVPAAQLVPQEVARDSHGFIIVDALQQTNLPGLFAAGDVTTQPTEHILIALGAGARAALHAYDCILAQRLQLPVEAVRSRGSAPVTNANSPIARDGD